MAYCKLIRKFHENQNKVFHELIKMDHEALFMANFTADLGKFTDYYSSSLKLSENMSFSGDFRGIINSLKFA